MITSISHQIDHNPEPDDAGTIQIEVSIFRRHQSNQRDLYEEVFVDSMTLMISVRDRIVVEDVLTDILTESGDITPLDAYKALIDVYRLALQVTSSGDYNPDCAIRVQMTLTVVDFDRPIEEAAPAQVEEFIPRLRPASRLAVESLDRNIYKKTSEAAGEIACHICWEQFYDGRSIVTLPCGHQFDDECIVEWFSRSHLCPLCRFELPREG